MFFWWDQKQTKKTPQKVNNRKKLLQLLEWNALHWKYTLQIYIFDETKKKGPRKSKQRKLLNGYW